MAFRRKWSDDKIREALDLLVREHGNLSKVARLTGIPRKSLEWRARVLGVLVPRRVVVQARSGDEKVEAATGEVVEAATSSPTGEASLTPEVLRARMHSEVRRYDRIIDVYSEHLLEPETVRRASPQQAATVVGIASDKRSMLLGEPIARVEVTATPWAELLRTLAEPRLRELVVAGYSSELIERHRHGLLPPSVEQLKARGIEPVIEGEAREAPSAPGPTAPSA